MLQKNVTAIEPSAGVATAAREARFAGYCRWVGFNTAHPSRRRTLLRRYFTARRARPPGSMRSRAVRRWPCFRASCLLHLECCIKRRRPAGMVLICAGAPKARDAIAGGLHNHSPRRRSTAGDHDWSAGSRRSRAPPRGRSLPSSSVRACDVGEQRPVRSSRLASIVVEGSLLFQARQPNLGKPAASTFEVDRVVALAVAAEERSPALPARTFFASALRSIRTADTSRQIRRPIRAEFAAPFRLVGLRISEQAIGFHPLCLAGQFVKTGPLAGLPGPVVFEGLR